MSIVRMTPSELDLKLRALLSQERNTEVEFLLHLIEFSDAKGHESLGYAKLWNYLRDELRLLDGAIWRRVHAMEVLRRFPAAADELRSGRLSMTALAMIEEIITPENAAEILGKTAGKGTREIEYLVACTKAPVPGKTTTIRKVPTPRPPSPAPATASDDASDGGAHRSAADSNEAKATPAPGVDEEVVVSPAPPSATERHGHSKPLSADQYSVQLIVRKEFIDKAERVKKIFGHKVPSGTLEAVLLEALDVVLRIEEKRLAVRKPKPAADATAPVTPPGSNRKAPPKEATRHETHPTGDLDLTSRWKRDPISAALKALVFARDGRKCSWRLANGKRCDSEHCLEIDHIIPVAKGGLTTLGNLRVVCRAHNQMHARNEFGSEFMAKFSRNETTSGAGSGRPSARSRTSAAKGGTTDRAEARDETRGLFGE